jgi:hypothetical protein
LPAAAPDLGCAAFAPAAGFIEAGDLRVSIALETVAFFVFAMSLSVRYEGQKIPLCARAPPPRASLGPFFGVDSGKNAVGHLPE